ncbi:sigma-70 family RNA polymerase sigma factor [Candidatus Peregrinibacteria bacterium]|jgi:RNA polymerase primary sigma factor|nr:sigma-70 family RNA polymerase sigma factor [Candidatus Peregrinibacteria bacterium]
MNVHLETSWVSPAQTVIEKAVDSNVMRAAQPLCSIMLATREHLVHDVTKGALGVVLASWDEPMRLVREKALVSPDPEQEQIATLVERHVEATKVQLQFLLELYHFQCRHWEARQAAGRSTFYPGTLEDFVGECPEYGTHKAAQSRNLLAEIGGGYHDVVKRMGFEFIVTNTEDESLRGVLEEDLWRAYNEKNGLPSDNRTYQAGTMFPEQKDCRYNNSRYVRTFGGIREAIDLIIKSTVLAHTDREGGCLVPLQRLIHGVLQKSLELGRVPMPEEVDYEGDDWEAVANGIRTAIETDLYNAVQRTTIPIPVGGSTTKRTYPFVWQHLLLETQYFSEYGIQIYNMWITRERLEKITDHPRAAIRKNLRRVFEGRRTIAHMEKAPPVFRLEAEPEDFDDMPRPELISYVEQNVLGKPFPSSKRLSCPYIRGVLQHTLREGITVPPAQTHFVEGLDNKSFQGLRDKAAFFRDNLDIPTYMRQILYSYIATPVKTIEKRIAIFEEEGAPRELYVHFLHSNSWEVVRRAARALKVRGESYQRIQAQLEVLDEGEEPGSEPESTPVPSAPVGRPPSNGSLTIEEQAAKERLEELGCPIESLQRAIGRLRPSTVLAKAEFMLEHFGEIRPSLLDKSLKVIRAKMTPGPSAAEVKAAEAKAEAEARVTDFLAERGLNDPPDYIYPTVRTLEIIREIEARGVPFEGQWTWINASQKQRDRGVERAWKQLTRGERLADLGDTFGFDPSLVPESLDQHDPDVLAGYCRVYNLLGYGIGTPQLNLMNAFGLPTKIREELALRLGRQQKRRDLTSEEEFWGNGQSLAVQVSEQLNSDVYRRITHLELLEEASPAQQQRLATVLESVGTAKGGVVNRQLREVLKSLHALCDLKRKVREALRFHRLGYGDMETCCMSRARARGVLERIAYLESGQVEITSDKLYRKLEDIEDIEELLDPTNLTPAQQLKRAFLSNLGCSPLWIERLARSAINLTELRANAFFLGGIELEADTCGKTYPEPQDYEDYLDKPSGYCRRYAVRRIEQKLANQYASQRLRDSFGMRWDHVEGWVEHRTTEATMWKKFEFLASDGQLRKEVDANPQLVVRYSMFSLQQIQAYVAEFNKTLAERSVSPKQRDLLIQVILRVLHVIARISYRRIISERMLESAKEQLIQGELQVLIAEAEALPNRRLAQPEVADFLTDKHALKLYEKAVGLLGEVGEDPKPKSKPKPRRKRKDSTLDGAVDGVIQLGPRKPFLTRDEEYELGVRKAAGDPEAFNELVTRNLKMVVWQARKFTWSGLPLADLIQEGNIGLMRAVEKFDPERGNKLSTYAIWHVRAHIIRYVENHGRMIRLPVPKQHAIQRMKKVRAVFLKEHERDATPEEIAEKMEISVEKVGELIEFARTVAQPDVELDAPMNDEDSNASRRGDFMGAEDPGFVDADLSGDRSRLIKEVRGILEVELRDSQFERAWDVFMCRFGLGEDQQFWTMQELGGKWGVTRERIRQIEKPIIEVLQNHPELRNRLLSIIEENT